MLAAESPKEKTLIELAADLSELNRIMQTANLTGGDETKIKSFLDKLNQISKKYTGKGIVVKGFTINIPPVSASVNFEFE